MNNEELRKRFEALMNPGGQFPETIARNHDGSYRWPDVAAAWLNWQACAAALAQAEAQPEQEPYCIVYEFDTWAGLHRSTSAKPYNGAGPDRAVKVYSTPQPAAPAVPAGWKLVPVEPTTAMLTEFWDEALTVCSLSHQSHAILAMGILSRAYAAMLAAAPEVKP